MGRIGKGCGVEHGSLNDRDHEPAQGWFDIAGNRRLLLDVLEQLGHHPGIRTLARRQHGSGRAQLLQKSVRRPALFRRSEPLHLA
ncbi:hypothetical protein D9M68_907490 [compost metagenome]